MGPLPISALTLGSVAGDSRLGPTPEFDPFASGVAPFLKPGARFPLAVTNCRLLGRGLGPVPSREGGAVGPANKSVQCDL